MTQKQLIEAVLVYSLIPLFTIGLLFLVAIIAHYQQGLLAENPLKQTKRSFSPLPYIVTALLFVLFTVGAVASSRRKKG